MLTAKTATTPLAAAHFVATDAGRLAGDRGRTIRGAQKQETNDCTVRALALACQVSYDLAHAWCEQQGRKRNRGFDLPKLLRTRGFALWGHRFVWVSCPAVPGQNRTDFRALHRSGALRGQRVIVREAKHVFCAVNGVRHDTSDAYEGRCVYGYWIAVPV